MPFGGQREKTMHRLDQPWRRHLLTECPGRRADRLRRGSGRCVSVDFRPVVEPRNESKERARAGAASIRHRDGYRHPHHTQ